MARTGALTDMAPDANGQQKRSYAVIGLGVLALVFVIVGGAFLLDARWRPRVGIDALAGVPRANDAGQLPSRAIASESEFSLLASPLQRQIAAGYLNYWNVYANAVESVDSSKLKEVAAGERLEEASAEVSDLKAAGKAAKIQVRHSFSVLSASANEATVRDQYVNGSYTIDPTTKLPVGAPGESQVSIISYSLRRINGAWKVTEAIREVA